MRAKVLWFLSTCLRCLQSIFDKGTSFTVGQSGGGVCLSGKLQSRINRKRKAYLQAHTSYWRLLPEQALGVFSVWPGFDKTQPIHWAKQIFTSKSGASTHGILFWSFPYHCGHPGLLHICTGICESSAAHTLCGKWRERILEWGSRWEISGEWWMSVIACPSAHLLHSPPVERNISSTSLRTCLPE